MSDKRTVATDALETLGTAPINGDQKRDAIHLAVEPVIAGERLRPGEHITVINGVATGTEVGEGLGIVDPFLTRAVSKGQRFWFVMYPRQVHSLRHVWTHPEFPSEEIATPIKTTKPHGSREISERWLRDFCFQNNVPSYEWLMSSLNNIDPGDSSISTGSEQYSGSLTNEFWDHVEIVIGHPVAGRPTYFSCSC